MNTNYAWISRVIACASERALINEQFGLKSLEISPAGYEVLQSFRESYAYLKVQQANQMLNECLDNLGTEQIGMLYTIMYLGRDKDYDRLDSPVDRYKSAYADFNAGSNRTHEIASMMEKINLAQYLKDGLEIVELKIQ